MAEVSLRALEECCERGLPAAVLTLEPTRLHRARFVRFARDLLEFDLLADPTGPAEVGGLQPLALCCVCFNHGECTNSFVTRVVDCARRNAAEPLVLCLEPPSVLASEQRRMAFRVPVFPDVGLEVKVVLPDKRVVVAQVADLSLTGISLELPGQGALELKLQSVVALELKLGRDCARLGAEVRRRDKRRYALAFRKVLRGGSLELPDELRAIVKAIELHWLKNRVR